MLLFRGYSRWGKRGKITRKGASESDSEVQPNCLPSPWKGPGSLPLMLIKNKKEKARLHVPLCGGQAGCKPGIVWHRAQIPSGCPHLPHPTPQKKSVSQYINLGRAKCHSQVAPQTPLVTLPRTGYSFPVQFTPPR